MGHESPRKRQLKRGSALLIAAVAALIVWVLIDAQLDYAHRERTNEGLFAAVGVKKGVVAFQRANGRLPGAQDWTCRGIDLDPKYLRSCR